MSKSRPKSYGGRNNWYDEEDNQYENDNSKNARERRKEKRMKNIIRSKNIDQLMNIEEDEE